MHDHENSAVTLHCRSQFTLAACRFAADVSPQPPQTVARPVVCTLHDVAGLDVRGTWAMSRR